MRRNFQRKKKGIPDLAIIGDKKEIIVVSPLIKRYSRKIIARGNGYNPSFIRYPDSTKEITRKLPYEIRPTQSITNETPIILPPLNDKPTKRIPIMPLNGQPKVVHLKKTSLNIRDKENCFMAVQDVNYLSEGTPKFKCENGVSRSETAKRNLTKAGAKSSRLIREGDGNSLNAKVNSKWHPKVIRLGCKKNSFHRLIIPKEINSENNNIPEVKVEEQQNKKDVHVDSNIDANSFNLTFGGCK